MQDAVAASVEALAREVEAGAAARSGHAAAARRGAPRSRGQTRLRVSRPIWYEVRIDPALGRAEILVSDARNLVALGVNSLGFVQWLESAPGTFTLSEAARALAAFYTPDEVQSALQVCVDSGFLEAAPVPVS
jgi:hypothetical protein